MEHAIRIESTGSPAVMQWQSMPDDPPGPEEILVRHEAVGLNFIDVYHRNGLYDLPLPSGLGLEAAGVVERLGQGVNDFNIGDRVAYTNAGIGAYTTARALPAAKAVKLPDSVDTDTAAAVMLKGLTAQYLLRRTYPVQPGDNVLIHAAAGGVGQLLSQWARHLGATVIGTVGSTEKAHLAERCGCEHVVLYREEDFAERVREITSGQGVQAVYDSVGKATFERSLDCLAQLGTMVSFGNASGAVPAFSPTMLVARGSLFFTRPKLMDYIAGREDLVRSSAELFGLIGAGTLKVRIGQRYPLQEAARAHRELEARQTTGSSLLIPGSATVQAAA